MSALKLVIIEDEPAASQLLTSIINEFCFDVQICGYADNVYIAKELLSKVNPDLIFVDVRLGSETIFELLDNIEYQNYKIVFTTAFANFALQAFKYEALDYLLKPYSPKAVIKVIERVKNELKSDTWLQFKKNPNKSIPTRISINTSEGINFIEPIEILYCTAEGSYCKIHTIDDSNSIMVSKSLSDIENQLDPDVFIRVHASFLVNLQYVKKYIKDDGGHILMSNGTSIPISRRKKQEFLDRVK